MLANRLSEDPRIRVLLLEAGGSDRHPYILAPAGFIKTFQNPRFNWCYTTEPVPGRTTAASSFRAARCWADRARSTAACSSAARRATSIVWAQLGNRGWSYDDVLPYFRKLEDRSAGADPFRGAGGPQHVSDPAERHPLCEAFIAGANSLGVPLNPDYNGAAQEGVAYYQRTIRNGRRHSAAAGFLHGVRQRPNLRVVTGAHVLRLDLAGRRVLGVTYRRGDRVHTAEAAVETLLSAGAVNSPHLLQLSGIGPAERLRDLGIDPVHDLPGVGEGLQDHYATRVAHRVIAGGSLNERAQGVRLLWEIAAWLAARNRRAVVQPGPCGRLHPLSPRTRRAGPAIRVLAGQLFRGRDGEAAAASRG